MSQKHLTFGKCNFLGHLDGNGVVSFLGPNVVRVSSSGFGRGNPEDFLKYKTFCWTRNEPNSWFMVDFGDLTVLPTHYTIGYGSGGSLCCPRNWVLQGSTQLPSSLDVNDPCWINLAVHTNDTSLCFDWGCATYTITPPPTMAFRCFRLLQTGKNSFVSNDDKDEWSDVLVMSGFELYGTVNSSSPNRFQSLPSQVPQTPPYVPVQTPPYVPQPQYVQPAPPQTPPPPYASQHTQAPQTPPYVPQQAQAPPPQYVPQPVQQPPPVTQQPSVTPPQPQPKPNVPPSTQLQTPPYVPQQAPQTPPHTPPTNPAPAQTNNPPPVSNPAPTQPTAPGSPSGQLKPCDKWDQCDQLGEVTHRDQYMHPCKWADKCRNQSDPVHQRRFFHGSVSVSAPAPQQQQNQSSPKPHHNASPQHQPQHKPSGPHQWIWGTTPQQKAPELKINNTDGTSILRPDSSGSNPAAITSAPITKAHHSCKMQVITKGNWLGLGVCDAKFQLSGKEVLGAQKGVLNCAYYCQDHHRIQMDGETKIDNVKGISAGDVIEISVDFDNNKITFHNNGNLVGTMAPKSLKLAEGKVFFCANLSAGSEVQLINSPSNVNVQNAPKTSANHPAPTPAPKPVVQNAPPQQQNAPPQHNAPAPTPTAACSKGASCSNTSDAAHTSQYTHPCRNGASCTNMTNDFHTNRFTHPCKYTYMCRYIDSASHCLKYSHDLPTVFTSAGLRLKDRSKLKDPLDNLPNNIRWQYCPQTEVTLPDGSKGKTVGWVMQDKRTKSGELCIRVSGAKTLIAKLPSDLKPSTASLKAPWYHKEILIFESDAIKKTFDTIFQQNVKGMNVTFNKVYDSLFQKGIPVYIIGGSVRDVIVGLSVDKIKDIDMGFGVTSTEICELAKKFGWTVTTHTPNGLVQFGDTTVELYLEGKSINGLNNDIEMWSNSLRSTGCDLHSEALYRDFTLNTLCYDPINKVVIDPTGFGVLDALNKKLRIPASFESAPNSPDGGYAKWNLWVKGNPTKLVRYWKFIAKGYTPIDDRTRKFIIDKAQTALGTHHCHAIRRGIKPKDFPAFKAAIVAGILVDHCIDIMLTVTDMGDAWFNANFS